MMKRRNLRLMSAVMSVLFLFSCFGQATVQAGFFDFFKNHKVTVKGDYHQSVIYDNKYLAPTQGQWIDHNGQKLWMAQLGNIETGRTEVVALTQEQYAQFVGNETVLNSVGAQPNPKLNFFGKIKNFFGGNKTSSAVTTETTGVENQVTATEAKPGLWSKIKGAFQPKSAQAPTATTETVAVAENAPASDVGTTAKPGFKENIKNSWDKGYKSGNDVGNKTYNGAKDGLGKVGSGIKGAGQKVGDWFKGLGKGNNSSAATPEAGNAPAAGNDTGSVSGEVAAPAEGQVSAPANNGKPGPVQAMKDGWKKGFDAGKNVGKGWGKGGSSATTTDATAVKPSVEVVKTPGGERYRDTATGKFISKAEATTKMGDATAATTTGDKKGVGGWLKDRMSQIKENTQKGYEKGRNIFKKKDGSQAAAEEGQGTENQETAAAVGAGGTAKPNVLQQGVQNVKNSLKSGFSTKNILVTAGITTALELGRQISRGEKPSLGKVVKIMTSAEFVGGFAGSVVGGAAGSFVAPMLSCIPVVGGVLSALAPAMGSVAGSMFGSKFAGNLKGGKLSFGEALRAIDWFQVVGQGAGSVIGGMLGGFLGPIGAIVGSMIGGFIGGKIAQFVKGWFGSRAQPDPYVGTVNLDGTGGLYQGSIPAADYEGTLDTSSGYAAPAYQVSPDAANSELQAQHLKITELQKIYENLITEGRQTEAESVLKELNTAKADFDSMTAAE